MPPVRVIVRDDAAAGPRAELWLGDERLAETLLYDGRLHVLLDPRPEGGRWLIEAASLALALDDAARRIMGR